MSDPGEYCPLAAAGGVSGRGAPAACVDPRVPLQNLSAVRARMDSLQRFLSDSVNQNTLIGRAQMDMVSSELTSAIQEILVNGAALIASCTAGKPPEPPEPKQQPPPQNQVAIVVAKSEEAADEEAIGETDGGGGEIVEIDAMELLAEHLHFCEVCGKGFKRDANLRMHMRAHGNQFKTPEALAKPAAAAAQSGCVGTKGTRFSCPFQGCNRNRSHRKFRPLKSVICVKNHFKRSHCPKMYACNRCNKKSFSVLADLKSHLRHCGESKWRCTCGTSFSRKDKLFGHMALFEGHMPAVVPEESDEIRTAEVGDIHDDDEEGEHQRTMEPESTLAAADCLNNGFFEGLLDEFGSIDSFNLQEMLGSPSGLNTGVDDVFGFL